jgi:hypothetical protein
MLGKEFQSKLGGALGEDYTQVRIFMATIIYLGSLMSRGRGFLIRDFQMILI